MTGLIGTLIEHPVAITGFTDATEKQEILGLTITFAVVTGVSLKLLPTFLADKIIGFLGCIHVFSFHKRTCTPKIDRGRFFIVGLVLQNTCHNFLLVDNPRQYCFRAPLFPQDNPLHIGYTFQRLPLVSSGLHSLELAKNLTSTQALSNIYHHEQCKF